MKVPLQMFLLLTALLPGTAAATSQCANASACAAAGEALYEAGQYEAAAAHFEQAVNLRPRSSEYQLWLGRSYGRAAESAGWVRALVLAPKALRAFETAVELNPASAEALEDLADYYRSAPAFLGGSERKAGEIEHRLERLLAGND